MKKLSIVAIAFLFMGASVYCTADETYSREAARIAVDKKMTLRPDPALAQQLTSELEILRVVYPCLAEYHYRGANAVSSVYGTVGEGAVAAYKNNPDAFLAPLVAEFGDVTVKLSDWGPYMAFYFVEVYNEQLLAEQVGTILQRQLEVGPFYTAESFSSIENQEFRLLPVIMMIGPNSLFFDGGGLDYDYESGTYKVTVAGGDCPSGCIYKRSWHFKVENNVAKFLKVTGNELSTISVTETGWLINTSTVALNAGAKLFIENNFPRCLLDFEWYKDGERVAEEDNGNLLIEFISEDDAGEYYCETVDTLTDERVRGESFTLDVKPENYLWRRDEFSMGYSLDYLWSSSIASNYHAFGYVDARFDPVVYIHGFGWVYVFGTYDGPVWLYDDSMGWCYTAVGLFPLLYSYDNAEWEYFEKGFWTGTHRLIYGFESQEWRFVPISEIEGFPRLVYE